MRHASMASACPCLPGSARLLTAFGPSLPPWLLLAGTPAAPGITAFAGSATAASITFTASPTARNYTIEGQRPGGSWTQLATRTTAGTQSLAIPAASWGKWLLRVTANDDNNTPSSPAVAPSAVTVGTPTGPTSVAITGGAEGALSATIG